MLLPRPEKETVELKPAGAGVAVTEANKKEYVNLVAEHRMITAIKPQITAFFQGFWELVPKRLISETSQSLGSGPKTDLVWGGPISLGRLLLGPHGSGRPGRKAFGSAEEPPERAPAPE